MAIAKGLVPRKFRLRRRDQAVPLLDVMNISDGKASARLKKRAEGNMRKEYRDAMFCTVVYGCMNILIEFVMGIVKMMILGSGFAAAAAGSAASIPATVINVVFLVIAVALLYRPVEKLYRRMCA